MGCTSANKHGHGVNIYMVSTNSKKGTGEVCNAAVLQVSLSLSRDTLHGSWENARTQRQRNEKE